jgi:CTD small phosphatase-like protein 2
MSEHFEVIIFTAAMQDYADWALENFQNESCISYRLYRQHALPYGGFYVKDLSRIGRDISKMIIVDNIAENFQLQPENGIFIKSWFTDPDDTALFELAPLLMQISESGVEDVRDALRLFRTHMLE